MDAWVDGWMDERSDRCMCGKVEECGAAGWRMVESCEDGWTVERLKGEGGMDGRTFEQRLVGYEDGHW